MNKLSIHWKREYNLATRFQKHSGTGRDLMISFTIYIFLVIASFLTTARIVGENLLLIIRDYIEI